MPIVCSANSTARRTPIRAPEGSPAETMHARLRAQTRNAHQSAEKAMGLPRSLASIAAYSQVLVKLWSLHSAYESALARFDWTALGIDFPSRRRARWLKEDILVAAPERELDPWPCYCVGMIEEALGILYVLEGSCLGGQIMQRQAILLPGISTISGARFFAGHGEQTLPMWQSFIQALNRFPAEGGAAAGIETGALTAFAQFSVVLNSEARSGLGDDRDGYLQAWDSNG
jgi:heme oxygenase